MVFGGNYSHFPFCSRDSPISFGYVVMPNQSFSTLIISSSEEIGFIDGRPQTRSM